MVKYLPERHRRSPSKLDQSSVPSKVLPPGQFVRESYEAWVEIAEKFPGAKGILVNSITCLEQNTFDYFADRPENYPPVYLNRPVLSLEDRPSLDLDPADRSRIMKWLEYQPESSVVYLCFGRFEVLGKEIARALELSGQKFLWSICTGKSSPYDLLLEGIMARMASKRLQRNTFTLVKELGLAVELRLDYVSANKDVVKAEEIAGAIRSLMDGEDTPRKRVKEMVEAARKALMDGESSSVAVRRFVDDIVGFHWIFQKAKDPTDAVAAESPQTSAGKDI
ncbi:unnamed protein product [Thlaspi arvense]|uniref:Uncharacterized protein n=1 Tax=Thlaspi arvense TaxID=13288 RepID=A0AAU9SBK3_THLAR|nr:unnamed protein product [Thlaspi arvense]